MDWFNDVKTFFLDTVLNMQWLTGLLVAILEMLEAFIKLLMLPLNSIIDGAFGLLGLTPDHLAYVMSFFDLMGGYMKLAASALMIGTDTINLVYGFMIFSITVQLLLISFKILMRFMLIMKIF